MKWSGHFIYVMGARNGPSKIGITSRPKSRLSTIGTYSPYKITGYWFFQCGDSFAARELERLILADLEHVRLSGEWVDLPFVDALRFFVNKICSECLGDKNPGKYARMLEFTGIRQAAEELEGYLA